MWYQKKNMNTQQNKTKNNQCGTDIRILKIKWVVTFAKSDEEQIIVAYSKRCVLVNSVLKVPILKISEHIKRDNGIERRGDRRMDDT